MIGAPEASPPGRLGRPVRAGFAVRFTGFLVDFFVLLAVLIAFSSVLGHAELSNASFGFELQGPAFSGWLVLSFAYFTLLEGGKRGQTIGMRIVAIRVIDPGRRESIGYGRALVRTIGRVIASIPLFLGYFWVLTNREKKGWHDFLAGSVVVPVSDFPLQAASTSAAQLP